MITIFFINGLHKICVDVIEGEIIFMGHGEATDNVKKIISDKKIYWSILTEVGKQSVPESMKELPKNIEFMLHLYQEQLRRLI